jgi:transposase InsO family protein
LRKEIKVLMEANEIQKKRRSSSRVEPPGDGVPVHTGKPGQARRQRDDRIFWGGPERLMRKTAHRHHYRYGSLRVREELRRDRGKRAGLKKVAALTRKNGLNARRRGKFIPTTNSNRSLPVCKNILNREFRAAGPGKKRVYDITYPRTLDGRVFNREESIFQHGRIRLSAERRQTFSGSEADFQ